MNDIYERIEELIDFLNTNTKLYDEGQPQIQDKEWDDKYFELQQLEKESGLILSNSPTQTISYEVVNSLSKKEHNHKMLSLDKTKSIEEVHSFLGENESIVMSKMDGLTCSLTYRNGELVSAETRGNGLIGEDILHNAKVIPSIPLKIPYKEELIIDGEIICDYYNFKEFEKEYKNPRNFASGSIRLLDSKECARRKLTFVAWDVISLMYDDNDKELSVSDKLEFLRDFKFTIVPYIKNVKNTIDDLNRSLKYIMFASEEEQYPIDGIVFKFNDCEYGRSLGETSHHFKNALAYKFYDETYTTELIDVEWTAGRTGVLTPVAYFKAIEIDGSIVERASLHNISIMNNIFGDNGPFIGQNISVFKSNMIIPQVLSAFNTSENEDFYKNKIMIKIPKMCPICGKPVVEKTNIDSTFLFCENPSCNGKLINKLNYFCGKKGLDIKGISKATLEKLIDWGWVENITDIFNLNKHRDEWIRKPGFGVKSIDKILAAIEASRECELSSFIAGLGIPLIGENVAKDLVKHFSSWDEFINAIDDNYSFYKLPNFGIEMNNSIINFDYSEAKEIVEKFIKFKDNSNETNSNLNSDLNGITFVITGKLNKFKNRDEIKKIIVSLGGKVTDSVSKNTNYLINNDANSTSSKNIKASSVYKSFSSNTPNIFNANTTTPIIPNINANIYVFLVFIPNIISPLK